MKDATFGKMMSVLIHNSSVPPKVGNGGGVESGRGRSPGCNLPTKDAGKKCVDSSQCESVCISNDFSNANCSCYAWERLGKGRRPDMCSFAGKIIGDQVD